MFAFGYFIPISGAGHPANPIAPGWGGLPPDPGYGRPDIGWGHPAHPIAGGGGQPSQPIALPPGTTLPPEVIWPAPTPPDKPVQVPEGKTAVAVWVSGKGWYFTIIDAPPSSGAKPPDVPPAQPKR